MSTHRYNGSLFTPRRGWNPTIGAHYAGPDIGFRFVGFKQPRAFTFDDFTVTLQARDICTIRPTTTTLTEFMFPGHGPEDFRDGGAHGISPYGDPGDLAYHDSIFRRMPIALNDPATGRMLSVGTVDGTNYACDGFTQLKGYAVNTGTKRYDDQHSVRAYRIGLAYLTDPFVMMDLKALLLDLKIAWQPRITAMLSGPEHEGNGNAGRALYWTAYLACLLGDEPFKERCRDVLRHVMDPETGLCQRLKQGSFYGNPLPWGPEPAGSGVPDGVDVAQRIEAAMLLLVYFELGMTREAWVLHDTLQIPYKRKWIAWGIGNGCGTRYADNNHEWIAIGRVAKADKQKGLAYAQRWPIPHPYNGGSVGPFQESAKIKSALSQWGDIGKARLALGFLP